jgi:negative regulator of flagellin synthesis FlgM
MTDITPIGGNNTAIPGIYSRKPDGQTGSTTVRSQQDTVEVSAAAQLLAKLAALPDVRQELIDRVQSEIAAGTYETDEKLNLAVEALLEDLA